VVSRLDDYNRWHASRRSESGESSPELTSPWHQLAERRLGDVRGLKVLEIGCGEGAFARLLAERGAKVTAADFSPVAVETASKLLEDFPGCRAIVADIEAIPFADEEFDLVVSEETLEHVPHPRRGLEELVRVTRRGGRLIVTTPNYLSPVGLYRLGKWFTRGGFSEDGQPINNVLFTAQRVWWLRRLGCRVEAVDGDIYLLPVPGGRTLDLRWLRRLPGGVQLAQHGCTVAVRGVG
jgi:ubiquinone/menaquinone biosynthesis C-methylase UbiE